MLDKLLNPLTTATAIGVAIRYLTTIIGAVVAILGALNWLTPEQVAALTKQVPELLATLGALVAAAIPLYAIFTKSSSDKAAKVAKVVDTKLPENAPVEIVTPSRSEPNIIVSAK